MRLKSILKESDEEYEKYTKEDPDYLKFEKLFHQGYYLSFNRGGTMRYNGLYQNILPDGEINPKTKIIDYAASGTNMKFTWPFKRSAPNFVEATIEPHHPRDTISTLVIDDFSEMFDCENLRIRGCDVKSFKGVESLNKLKILHLRIPDAGIDCGLLRLIKCKGLTYVNISSSRAKTESKCEHLTEIINKHLETHNVPECQQDLIEAGLQEYAKL